jgi:NAD(P)H-flavin reductase
MLHKNEIGVCLDEDVAYLLEEKYDENLITIIHADDDQGKKPARNKSRNRKQAFLKKIFELIRDFDKVSLCGPTTVKTEIKKLFKDNSVKEVQINESEGEEITESQKLDFINHYFDAR